MLKKIAVAAALLMLAVPASPGSDSALGCFVRTYDRAHLAKHPDQIVTAVKLHIKKPDPGSLSKYWFLAQFKLRAKVTTLHTSGICDDKAPGLHCFVECDGGGVNLTPRSDHAIMYLDRIRVAACGHDVINAGEELSGGKDDRVFRLDRVDDRMCERMKP